MSFQSGAPCQSSSGQPVAVAAQGIGDAAVGQPADPARCLGGDIRHCSPSERLAAEDSAGNDALDQPGDGDGVPLQALGGVHGQDLDGVGATPRCSPCRARAPP